MRAIQPYSAFMLFFMTFFMTDSVYDYFSIYLNTIGLTKTAIGAITGTASLMALLMSPVFGALADRTKSKNRLLQITILLSAILYPLILANKSVLFIMVVYTAYSVVRNPQHHIATSMALEYTEQSAKSFGSIRMMGSIGYMLMMLVVGWVAGEPNGRVENTFWLFAAVALANVPLVFMLPRIQGHNRKDEGEKVSLVALVKNKPVMLLILFHVLLNVSSDLCRNYFSIYFTDDMGGSNQQYAMMLAFSALVELPFLFLADRFIKKLGEKKMLFILGCATALRWFVAFFAAGTATLFAVQCGNFISALEALVFSMLLSKRALPQHKTSVQTLAGAIYSLIRIAFSSFLGGFLADAFGIRPLFLVSGVLVTVVTVVFVCFILDKKPKRA